MLLKITSLPFETRQRFLMFMPDVFGLFHRACINEGGTSSTTSNLCFHFCPLESTNGRLILDSSLVRLPYLVLEVAPSRGRFEDGSIGSKQQMLINSKQKPLVNGEARDRSALMECARVFVFASRASIHDIND